MIHLISPDAGIEMSIQNEFRKRFAGDEKNCRHEKEEFFRVLDLSADGSNYPVYFHCYAGADRTGTLAYMLEALREVPPRRLKQDYNYTAVSFSDRFIKGKDDYPDAIDREHHRARDRNEAIQKHISFLKSRYPGLEDESAFLEKQPEFQNYPAEKIQKIKDILLCDGQED